MSKQNDDGGELSNIPNDKYRKFFAKFDEIETLDIKDWKVAHLLGYFCKKYKETYGVDYTWKFNNPNPNKCFEVWQANVLASKLSANPQILKDYIDWGFQNIVPKAKRRLTSISFLTNEEVLIPYKMNVLLGGKKKLETSRSTPLPSEYVSIFEQNGCRLSTYGDLAFLTQMDPIPQNVLTALNAIKEKGFDEEILKRIV